MSYFMSQNAEKKTKTYWMIGWLVKHNYVKFLEIILANATLLFWPPIYMVKAPCYMCNNIQKALEKVHSEPQFRLQII